MMCKCGGEAAEQQLSMAERSWNLKTRSLSVVPFFYRLPRVLQSGAQWLCLDSKKLVIARTQRHWIPAHGQRANELRVVRIGWQLHQVHTGMTGWRQLGFRASDNDARICRKNIRRESVGNRLEISWYLALNNRSQLLRGDKIATSRGTLLAALRQSIKHTSKRRTLSLAKLALRFQVFR